MILCTDYCSSFGRAGIYDVFVPEPFQRKVRRPVVQFEDYNKTALDIIRKDEISWQRKFKIEAEVTEIPYTNWALSTHNLWPWKISILRRDTRLGTNANIPTAYHYRWRARRWTSLCRITRICTYFDRFRSIFQMGTGLEGRKNSMGEKIKRYLGFERTPLSKEARTCKPPHGWSQYLDVHDSANGGHSRPPEN